jgi:phosphoribosylaminoimidazolecarboxamide formyltransferase/IMP cyclohydrolase
MSEQNKTNPQMIKIKRALLSVSNKDEILEFAKELHHFGVELLSTGGTSKLLKENGIPVTDVSEETGFPEIMDGRVKTLHPKIHGGLLAVRSNIEHQKAMQDNGIREIDMLVVNLYPFSETVAKGAGFNECIENIDIGGPAMIRAASKNHAFVAVVTDPQDYQAVLEDMRAYDGCVTSSLTQKLAASAFALTASYDSHIASWLSEQTDGAQYPRRISFAGSLQQELRYGENPHQTAALYLDASNRPGVATATQIQGKELSYNNLNDTDAAFELVAEFDEPAVAIIKHANPCGVAIGTSTLEAYRHALSCDTVSAFGGIIALNRALDATTAEEIIKVFSEVIIAPSVTAEALEVLKSKKNLRVLTTGALPKPDQARSLVKSIAGGLLVQDADRGIIKADDLKIVTDREPTEEELRDMLFAFKVCKHVKSNAIIYAKNRATVGIGAGQMSRVDSATIAVKKSLDAAKERGFIEPLTKGSVAASDAFFPFADGLITIAEAGATAIIQPGGSIRDDEVINAANERGIAMAFTGMRHFRH